VQAVSETRSKTFVPDAFAGQVVFITGAGRGMGKVAAARFAALGARVAITDLVEARVRAAADEVAASGADVLGVAADVGKESDVRNAVDATIARFGRIDVLVNAAGSYGAAYRATHETPVDEWDSVFASNVRGSFLTAKHVVPHMMQAGRGRIINFASNAARTLSPLLGCSYTAAKTAILGLTRHLSREYAAHGILVNTIAPGPTDGERTVGLLGNKQGEDALLAQLPLGRLAEPDEIVDVVLFLASDASRFMTGAIVDVSGGLILA
jgi:NAD(P)-dependent dehydrogenase (short-subunit alcohol dehydrogenase family)